jgi:hypothetical protein
MRAECVVYRCQKYWVTCADCESPTSVPSVQHDREVQSISCLHGYQATHRPTGRVITHNTVSVSIGTFLCNPPPFHPACRDGSHCPTRRMLLLPRMHLVLENPRFPSSSSCVQGQSDNANICYNATSCKAYLNLHMFIG